MTETGGGSGGEPTKPSRKLLLLLHSVQCMKMAASTNFPNGKSVRASEEEERDFLARLKREGIAASRSVAFAYV